MRTKRLSVAGVLTLALMVGSMMLSGPTAHAATAITDGDLIVSAGSVVDEYTPTGTFVQQLMNSSNGMHLSTGSAFDGSGNLYVTDFSGNQILKRDAVTGAVTIYSNDTLLGDAAHPYNSPESIAFNSDYSRAYVSDAQRFGTSAGIHVLNTATGAEVAFYALPSSSGSSGQGESDWLAFNAAGVLYMTNENPTQGIMQVNQTTGDIVTPSFVANLPTYGYALSFDKSGNVWLGDTNTILEYNASGALVRTISNAAFSLVFAAVFNPAGDQFYAGDLGNGNIYHYDLSGALIGSFNPGIGGIDGLSVAGAKLANQTDNTPPSCSLKSTGVNASGQKYIVIATQDSDGGLAASPKGIVVTASSNVTVSIPPYTAGATTEVDVTATKINQSLGASISLQVTDAAGNVTNCDPALLNLSRDQGKPASTTAHGIAKSERWVHVYNGTPGVTTLSLSVNGKNFQVSGLAAGATRTIDVGSALVAGSNSITLTATGTPGGSVIAIVADR